MILTDTILHIKDHPNFLEIRDLWNDGMRAKAIIDWLEERGLPQVKYENLARYGQRNWSSEKVTVTVEQDFSDINSLIADISENQGTVTKVTVDNKDAWGWEKQEDGTNKQVKRNTTSRKIEFVPAEDTLDLKPGVVPEFTISVRAKSETPKSKPDGWKLAVSVPDLQVGGFMDDKGSIEPTQDEEAIDVAFQIMNDLEHDHGIDLIVNAGDNLDLPAFSSHRSAPGYTYTTQYAIDRYTTIIAAERAVAPDSKIVEMPSNHVARMINTIVDKVPALTGIRRGNSDTPILSLAYLCRFDEYDVEYVEGWPDGEYWASPNLRFVHGDATSGVPGATARKYLRDNISTVYGHSHHSELIYNTQNFKDGERTSFAGSAGTLARIDGFLPSAKTGITDAGKLAAQKSEAWQQGIWLVWYKEDGSEDPWPEPVKISRGKAIFRGKMYEAKVDLFGEPK